MVIEEWKNVPIAYRRRTGPYGAENKQLMEDFKAYLRARGRLRADSVVLGIALDDPAATPGCAQRYDVGLVVEPGKEPAGLPVRRVDGGRYAVFTVAHTARAVAEFWRELPALTAGLPVDRARPVVERYAAAKVAAHLCEFCVPLQ